MKSFLEKASSTVDHQMRITRNAEFGDSRDNKPELPLVSVVIVNYNAVEYLTKCLQTVFQSDYPNIQVIVVDNASTDGSVDCIERLYRANPRLAVIANKENYGPAKARNIGIGIAAGKYIAFLDNDTQPEAGWLGPLVRALEQSSTIGACQGKLLLMSDPSRFDCAGNYLGSYGFLVSTVVVEELDEGQVDRVEEIFSAKSAAMVVRSDVLKETGLFDEDYFIYVEETDLSWRIWLRGYRIVFIPDSRVHHAFGTTSKVLPRQQQYLVRFHGTKNYITTLLKNFGLWNLLRIVPVHIAIWIGLAGWFAIKRQPKDSVYILKAILWCVRNFRGIWRKRESVQRMRRVNDSNLMRRIMTRRSLMYYINKLSKTGRVGNAERWKRR